MTLHSTTFEYLKPTEEQTNKMSRCREAARVYASILEAEMPEGPDKIYVLRRVRETAMWVNVGITRFPDGEPRI